jgi:hypothetical protein
VGEGEESNDVRSVANLLPSGLPLPQLSLRALCGRSPRAALNEATQYEFGVGYAKHMRTGDTFMRMSMTNVALIWNQAALLHKKRRASS